MSNKPTDTMKPGSYEEKLWNSFKENRRRTLFPAALHAEGATGSAVMFSLIQAALENGLDLYNYLTWFVEAGKGLGSDGHSDSKKTPALECGGRVQNKVRRKI